MFDYQLNDGMLPDCIYPDKRENNYRDTKPSLAAWAVWEIFKRTHDTAFVRSIYAPLIRYHKWWYLARDHNSNGLCEFGSTDGTRQAAAWESGMDNAVRFDSAVMLRNASDGWSLNQESVDLNCYLYKEKQCLARLAAVIGRKQDAKSFEGELSVLKAAINKRFYKVAAGYYFDRRITEGPAEKRLIAGPESDSWINVYSSIGWLPLWVGIASDLQARGVMRQMNSSDKFNTYVPLPVLAADNPAFSPEKGYWRGPVWLDQFYFGVRALEKYGKDEKARRFVEKLLDHASGILTDAAIRENYNPVTGAGLNAKNFSWSAAHLLMLLINDID